MNEFFDTSVLVAAFWGGHVHHPPSVKRFAAAEKRHSACGIHSLAEVYSVMTALPVKPMVPPEQVLLFVEEVRDRLTLVSLSADEYFAAIQNAASRGFTGGRIYDALLLASAAKCKAQAVYTSTLSLYQALAPRLARRGRTRRRQAPAARVGRPAHSPGLRPHVPGGGGRGCVRRGKQRARACLAQAGLLPGHGEAAFFKNWRGRAHHQGRKDAPSRG